MLLLVALLSGCSEINFSLPCCSFCSACFRRHCFQHLQLSALVLSKLLSSLPHMRKHLRAGYLLGDTRHDGTAGGLAMNNKVRW
jgi:hypothetical protein